VIYPAPAKAREQETTEEGNVKRKERATSVERTACWTMPREQTPAGCLGVERELLGKFVDCWTPQLSFEARSSILQTAHCTSDTNCPAISCLLVVPLQRPRLYADFWRLQLLPRLHKQHSQHNGIPRDNNLHHLLAHSSIRHNLRALHLRALRTLTPPQRKT